MRGRRPTRLCRTAMMAVALLLTAAPALALSAGRSITDNSVRWPGLGEVWRVLSLQDYNTRIVVAGAALLGLAAGMIGTFMLLRKRALLGDALSHATFPGIALAFMVMAAGGGSGKALGGLLIGATATGLLGVGWILLIRAFTRLKEDAALGIVLSVLFGLGVALMGIIQNMQSGSAAGLESFIYGKTASMLRSDAQLIAATALLIAVGCLLLFKEFAVLCFDPAYARTQGWPVLWLDLLLMVFVTAVTVIGLQAVGLILVLAMLIIPPAAARFWTERLWAMFIISAAIGAASGMLGAGLSALLPRLPAGAIIVLSATAIFLLSLLIGPARGVLVRWRGHAQLQRTMGRQHLLRAVYELCEQEENRGVGVRALLQRRSWSPRELASLLRLAQRESLLHLRPDGAAVLTPRGLAEARRLVRNHRLWEMYLIRHADIAPSHVDRDADAIEHVLGKDLVAELEAALDGATADAVPASPHPVPERG